MHFLKAAHLGHQVFKPSDLLINNKKSLMLPNISGCFGSYKNLKANKSIKTDTLETLTRVLVVFPPMR